MLGADVGAEADGGSSVEVFEHHAISAVRHDAEQFARFAEHQIATGGVEFAEQPAQNAAVQLYVIGGGKIDLKLAFPVIALSSAHQDCILEFKRIGRDVIKLTTELAGIGLAVTAAQRNRQQRQ